MARSSRFVLMLCAVMALASANRAASADDRPVPPAYASMYDTLHRALDQASAQWPGGATGHKPVYSTDLLVANSNRGEALLLPETLGAVRVSLDHFRDMGIGSVKFALQYPMLKPGFPHADAYLAFYKSVVQEAHARGIKVMPHLSVLFADTPFSSFKDIYKGLDFATFKREYAAMVQLVARELHPDYLTLLTEPDTHARLTGLTDLSAPDRFAEVISAALEGLPREGIKVGAGSGSWSGPRYAEALAGTGLDYICIHIYPVNAKIMANAKAMAGIAHAHGKAVVIDEAWLYKTDERDGGDSVARASGVFRRDAWSFWQPLDLQFMDMVDSFARHEDVSLVSFFWSNLFFATLDYTPALETQPYQQVTRQLNRQSWQAMQDGHLSPIGAHYTSLIASP